MINTAVRHQRTNARPWRGILLRQGLPVSLGIVLIYLLVERVGSLDNDQIATAFGSVGALQWALALAATGVSFLAVGRYDVVLHRILQTGIADRAASHSGKTAIALSQTLGLGVLTGAIVRWRMIPSLSFVGALSLSLTVALSFIAGWAVFASMVLLGHPLPAVPNWIPMAVLTAAFALVILSVFKPALTLAGRAITLPPLTGLSRLPWLAAVDTAAAAAALWFLLPAEIELTYSALLPAFLLAFGAGLICGTPGGVGAFELTLLALLPDVPQSPLLAAVMAFRLVYFAVPAVLALFALLTSSRHGAPRSTPLRKVYDCDIENAPFAEANLLNAGDLSVLNGPHGSALAMVARRGQSLIALGPTLMRGADGFALSQLNDHARNCYLRPFIYKGDARLTCAARRAGWAVRLLFAEAVLRPGEFNLEDPRRRQLRRKLRKAINCGLDIRHAGSSLPIAAMTDIAAEWATQNGGERGFSMGRFDPGYIRTQRVYLAYVEDQIVAFATFNINAQQWTLDLMRTARAAPDGTMHALVTSALQDAAILNCPEFSLAAAPIPTTARSAETGAIVTRWLSCLGGQGLYQFKASFSPSWRPRYIASPSRLGLILAGLDVARAIHAPARIQTSGRDAHNHYDRIRIASTGPTCDREGEKAARGLL